MSSLQKFHRRTQSLGPATWPATAIGGGDNIYGFWLGTAGDGTSKLIVAPNSTEARGIWGSNGTVRNTTSNTNGLANTNTLYAFGSAAHPTAYYCRTLVTGGYNTWYLPAKDELTTLHSNKSAVPFATGNSFDGSYYWSSTEVSATGVWLQNLSNGAQGNTNYGFNKASNLGGGYYIRATRRTTV